MINLKEFFNDDEQKVGLSALGLAKSLQNAPVVKPQNTISTPQTQDAIKANFAPKNMHIMESTHTLKLNFNNRLIG